MTQYARPRIYANTEKSDNVPRATKYIENFYKAVLIDTPDQFKKGIRGAGAIPHEIGDPGDRRLRNLRRKVRMIRSMATLEMAMNPSAGEIAKEIRKRTETVLRNPHSYEQPVVW